jgi:ligand-binding SRPBCC domain-containing protein
MMHRIHFEQWVPFAIDKVFLFFANPENLPRIMPPRTETQLSALRLVPPRAPGGQVVRNIDQLAGAGSEISTLFRPLPFIPLRTEWIALIIEFEWNHHFADIQKKGPFKRFQHRHEFSIEYDAGIGPLGDLAQRIFVAPGLKQTFEYRQKMLEKLLT